MLEEVFNGGRNRYRLSGGAGEEGAASSGRDKKKKIDGSWGKCLRAGFRTPVEGKRGRWAD